MTRLFTNFFYITTFVLLLAKYQLYLNSSSKNLKLVLFATPLQFLSQDFNLFPILFFISLLAIAVSLLTYRKSLFIITNILLLVTFSMMFSFGKINHDHHGWLICIFLLCFLDYKNELNQKYNFWLIRLMQGLFLVLYFISGCWKLKKIILMPPPSIAHLGLEHMSYSIAEGGGPNDFILDFFTKHPNLVAIGFVSVLFFQLSTIFPIVMTRHFKKWAIFCCLFHISTGITMGIWFRPNIALAIFLLFLTEIFVENEKVLTSAIRSRGYHFLSIDKL